MNSQLGPVRQQAITWANMDPVPCHSMAPQGHNDWNDASQWQCILSCMFIYRILSVHFPLSCVVCMISFNFTPFSSCVVACIYVDWYEMFHIWISVWLKLDFSLVLTHWGLMTHVCISKLTNIGSDNGLSPGWCQAIIWTNAGILFIGILGTNFSEILSEIHVFSFKRMHLKMLSAKWPQLCLCLNVLTHCGLMTPYGNIDLGQHWLIVA